MKLDLQEEVFYRYPMFFRKPWKRLISDPVQVRVDLISSEAYFESFEVLQRNGIVSPETMKGNGLNPDSNKGLVEQNKNAGLTPEQAQKTADQANVGGNQGLAQNQHHGAPSSSPASGDTPSQSGGSAPAGSGGGTAPAKSGATPAKQVSGSAPSGSGSATPAKQSGGATAPAKSSAVDAAANQYDQKYAEQTEGWKPDAGAVHNHQPSEDTKMRGEDLAGSAGPTAAFDASKRAANAVMNDIGKLSAGQVAGAVGVAASAGAASYMGNKVAGKMATSARRQAVGQALGQMATKRGAAWAATAAVGSTGVGAPVAAVMTIGNIALGAKDVYDLYQMTQGGGAGTPAAGSSTGTTVPGGGGSPAAGGAQAPAPAPSGAPTPTPAPAPASAPASRGGGRRRRP